MENNGKGIFYGVIGVATLIIAIIGATFAFFSASAELDENDDEITGQTNEDIAGALTLDVKQLNTTVEGTNPNLVPSDVDGNSVDSINAAITANCIDEGYTGCHIYKITATSTQNVQTASVNLDSLTVSASTKTNWAYSIYTGTDTAANEVLVKNGTFDLASAYDIHQGASMTANTAVNYYLIIYLRNIEDAQNPDEYGTYNGTVSFNVAGGKVSATFSAATGTDPDPEQP